MIPWPPCKKFQCISIFLKHVLKWVLEWRQNGGNSTLTIVHPVNKFECIIIEMYSISISYRGLCSLWMYLCHLTLKLISYTYFDSVCEDGATLTLKEVFNPKKDNPFCNRTRQRRLMTIVFLTFGTRVDPTIHFCKVCILIMKFTENGLFVKWNELWSLYEGVF